MQENLVKVWVTKNALTRGIEVVTAEVFEESGMIAVYEDRYAYYVHGNDWHKTPEAAVARAQEMRDARIKSLQRSIAKMEKLKFDIPRS